MKAKWFKALCGLAAAICAVCASALPVINGSALTYMSWFTDKEEVTDYAYSFAVIGDPQYVTMNYTSQLPIMYDWILDNQEAKNIQHVFGLGDTVHTDVEAEWSNAKKAISKMDGKISYSLVRGNHDSTAKLSSYFWYEDYTSQFGGFYKNGDVSTSWKAMTIGETKYLFITLDYGATDEELAWASEVVEDHLDHKVIVTTHSYLSKYGVRLTDNDAGSPVYTSDKNGDPERAYNSGDDIWNKFISRHPNMFMVISGHVIAEDIQKLQSVGVHGNTVTQLMINPQGLDNNASLGPTGMVAILYFSEDGSQFEVEWYSTIKQQYWKSKNQFTMSLPDTTIPEHVFDQQVTTDAYLKTPATHMDQAEYYYSCECGWKNDQTFKAGEKVGEHTWMDVVDEKYAFSAATCTDGGIYYKSCECGEKSKLIFQTASLGHVWEGNCDERHCTREGCGISSPTNHKWNEGEVMKEAEVGVAGETTYTCTRGTCQATKTEEIPALTEPTDSSSEEPTDSSSQDSVDSSTAAEDSSTGDALGGMLNCSGSISGTIGMLGVMMASAFVLLKKKEN